MDANERVPVRRRAGFRQAVTIEAALFGGVFDAPVSVETFDLSPDGMFLRSDLLLEPGERVLLSFDVPGTRHAVVVDGEVMRSYNGRHSGMGIAFRGLPSIDETILRDALARHRKRAAASAKGDGAWRC